MTNYTIIFSAVIVVYDEKNSAPRIQTSNL